MLFRSAVIGNIDVSGDINVNSLKSNTYISAIANVVSGNVTTTGQVIATANITGGNLLTGGVVSATGNLLGGNVLTGGQVSATGNVTGGNVNTNNLVGTGLTVTSTGALNLQPTGNVVVNSKYINGVVDPVQDQDVATKYYVDNLVSTQIGRAHV